MASELTWLGHATWSIATGGYTILLDPFLDDNPTAPVKADDVEADFILISHGHYDHIADAAKIAKRTGAKVIAIFEICEWLAKQGVENTHAMNIGGGYDFPFGRVKMTKAVHSSALPDGTYGGEAAGYVLFLPEGKVYFACDTGLFSDMQLIGNIGLELAAVPIGDNFTMGPDDALTAVSILKPKQVVPVHTGTWPVIEQNVEAWTDRVLRETTAKPVALAPGEKVVL